MSGAQGSNQQPPSNTWTEPPWSGWIETTGDALLILEAARRGLIPRVTRRLVDSERKMITSGSVFVFDEDESGIKRWTDGFFWSPSRILGNFLLYRETDKRGAGHRGARSDPDLNDQSQYGGDGLKLVQSLSRPKTEAQVGVDKHRERTLMGSLTNSYKFKPDGLMKKTFSLTIGGVAQHLISYYKIEDVENGRLRAPSSLPELASLEISAEYLDKTHFRNPPKVEMGVDGVLRYRGEADDIDTSSSSILHGPLSSGLPLLTDGRVAEGSSNPNKRGKRYDPYGSPAAPKRPRRNTKSVPPEASPTSGSVTPPAVSPATQQPPPPTYPDPNVPMALPVPYPSYGVPYYQMPSYPRPPPPPLPHSYPQGAYPQSSGSSQQPPQTIQPPGSQYTYAAFPPPPPAGAPAQPTDSSHGAPPAQPYYSYYPPPPHAYTTYPPPGPVTWSHYPTPYPTQQPVQQQQQLQSQLSEGEPKAGGSGEMEHEGDRGVS
ncbi:Gti1/Pac2 family-domain-containing protein [Crucibulum laeve]|uniref:Gti1/Pac2 family-domain-containing protein n=1 Tax=Crucibulum laeve TaxID=68775 RepID=A0A5C3LZG9_9AGAR|nr:Gti1/Pac2 family-domain-containing protein [Crucibulum laeve]